MVNKRKNGGQSMTITKEQVLQDPMIKQALKAFVTQQGGGIRQGGTGWWEDFNSWLKKNKVISTGSKIASAIATATGYVPLATALTGISGVSSKYGYGKIRGGQYAQSIAMPSASSQTPYLKF